jgi:cell division septum initiation protein DivIVA
LLRHRVELIEQAQHEADVCRARAAEEARAIIQDALEQANALLRGLRQSDAALRELFDSGALAHSMPPPRHSAEAIAPQQVPEEPAQLPAQLPAERPAELPAGGQHHNSLG